MIHFLVTSIFVPAGPGVLGKKRKVAKINTIWTITCFTVTVQNKKKQMI